MSADGFDLDGFLSARRAGVEAALQRALTRLDGLVPGELGPALRHGVGGGGKRLRPILCVTAVEACGGRPDEAAFDLAAALELIHGYSLMHDDLPCMDDAELRRGRPTTHRAHGEPETMRAGAALIPAAAMQAHAAARALGADNAVAGRIASRLMEAAGAGGMVGGQWLDLLGEGRTLTEAELDELHRHKTGALLVASLLTGAAAAGARDGTLEALERYGRGIGLAFQVADDILDATQDAGTLGKNPSDAELDKSTYVALHGLDEARLRARALVDDARRSLDEGGIEAPALHALAEYIVDRES